MRSLWLKSVGGIKFLKLSIINDVINFLERGKNALTFDAPCKKEAQLKAVIEKLQKIIGKQTEY
ncbi:hypothetical protein JCM12298_30480 [Desulfothermus naphthae]